MRLAAAGLLALIFADATPKGGNFRETRWSRGDFAASANEPTDRLVESGETVGIRITGRGESCLLRRRAFPLHLPCRLRFRARWSQALFGAAYPSVHIMFNPPPLGDEWWKEPITPHVGVWKDRRRTFLFHFSTDPSWRQYGMTDAVESAAGRHKYFCDDSKWVNLEIRLDGANARILADGQEVGSCEADLKGFTTFTYGIGDQSSTFVELDEFTCEEGR